MELLDELIEKKDLIVYINLRIEALKLEIQNNITKLPDEKIEKMLNTTNGRIKELKQLRKVITQGRLKEENKTMYHKTRNELENRRIAQDSKF